MAPSQEHTSEGRSHPQPRQQDENTVKDLEQVNINRCDVFPPVDAPFVAAGAVPCMLLLLPVSVDPSTSALTKLRGPVLELFQPLLTDRWSDGLQTSYKVLILYWAYLVHRHREQLLTQRAQGPHCSVFGESSNIRTRETYSERQKRAQHMFCYT